MVLQGMHVWGLRESGVAGNVYDMWYSNVFGLRCLSI